MKVLVVSAHLDDEVLGPGGTLRRHASMGDEVFAHVACCGSNLRYDADSDKKLQSTADQVAEIIGFKEISLGKLPDQGLDTLSLVQVITPLEKILDKIKPEILYTHDVADINRDHRTLFEALSVAARPYSAPTVKRFATFETPSSTEWGRSAGMANFDPHLFVDISETLDDKLRAFALYESEVRPWPHPRSLEALRARARYWGSIVGCEAAEAFRVVREIERVR
jgi:LmbE family N-acetylglucosaminyl deacetylase